MCPWVTNNTEPNKIVTVNSVLRWAAGANVASPSLTCSPSDLLLELMGVSIKELVELLREHRLTQRFLLRASHEQPAWCGPQLLLHLAKESEQTRLRLQKQIDALNEIAAVLRASEGGDSSSLILIKGYSLFALSGQMHHQRHAGDLDVLAADAELLWSVLGDLGFERKRHYTHEFGKAKRGEVVVDVHNFYPVPSYPHRPSQNEEGSNAALAASFTVLPHCQSTVLSYKELRRYCVTGRGAGAQTILVPQSAALAFILVAHLFRNYVERPHFNSPNLGVRLGELTDVVELFHHSDFDGTLFSSLVQQHQAHDAFAFVSLMAREHLGFLFPQQSQAGQEKQQLARQNHPLQQQQSQSSLVALPENLFWGGWLATDEVAQTLQMRDLATLLCQIGVTSIVISCAVLGNDRKATLSAPESGATTLKPFLHKHESISLQVAGCSDSEMLVVRIGGLRQHLLPCSLRLYLGSKNRVTVHIDAESKWTTEQKDCVPELKDFCCVETRPNAPDVLEVELNIPLESLVFTGMHRLTVPVLIGLKTGTLLGQTAKDDAANVNYYGCNLCFDRYNFLSYRKMDCEVAPAILSTQRQ